MNKYERKIEGLLSKKRISNNTLNEIEEEFDNLLLYLKYQGYPLSYCILERDWDTYEIGFRLAVSQGTSAVNRFYASWDKNSELRFRASDDDTMWLVDDIKKYRGKVTEITTLVKTNLKHVYRHTNEDSSFKRLLEDACNTQRDYIQYQTMSALRFFGDSWRVQSTYTINYNLEELLGREIPDEVRYTRLRANIKLSFRLNVLPEAVYDSIRENYIFPVEDERYRVLEYNVTHMNPDCSYINLTLAPPNHPVDIRELENFPGRIGDILLGV